MKGLQSREAAFLVQQYLSSSPRSEDDILSAGGALKRGRGGPAGLEERARSTPVRIPCPPCPACKLSGASSQASLLACRVTPGKRHIIELGMTARCLRRSVMRQGSAAWAMRI